MPSLVASLHRSIGNRAVGQLLQQARAVVQRRTVEVSEKALDNFATSFDGADKGLLMYRSSSYPHVSIPFTGRVKKFVPRRTQPSTTLTFTDAHYSPSAVSERYNYQEVEGGKFQAESIGGEHAAAAHEAVTAALGFLDTEVVEGSLSKAEKGDWKKPPK